ncbi:MAG: flagellar biosynthesis protein FlhB [Candidatus Eisenbacteria bacterium]|nr:flagellar biosynthesis protein FlhB [Candidatus Eisenbacteria bacterium]
MSSQGGERTEQPTHRKKQRAKSKGQVVKSQELKTALMTISAAAAIKFLGPAMKELLVQRFEICFSGLADVTITPASTPDLMFSYMKWGAALIAPIVSVLVVTGIGVNILTQGGLVFSSESIRFNPGALNPVRGAARLFGSRVWFKLGVDMVKVVLIGLVCWSVLRNAVAFFINNADVGLARALGNAGGFTLDLFFKSSLVLLLLGAADFSFQRRKHNKDLMMTKQEVKDESKESEGDPLIKGRIRSAQKDLLRRRMMQAVPEADVVLTNPTHIAVALKYDPEKMGAPRVVAKGQRLIAERIKAIARAAGVPVVEDKPLARALFKMAEVGQEIPVELYRAVAEVLSYVYRVKGKKVPVGKA